MNIFSYLFLFVIEMCFFLKKNHPAAPTIFFSGNHDSNQVDSLRSKPHDSLSMKLIVIHDIDCDIKLFLFSGTPQKNGGEIFLYISKRLLFIHVKIAPSPPPLQVQGRADGLINMIAYEDAAAACAPRGDRDPPRARSVPPLPPLALGALLPPPPPERRLLGPEGAPRVARL